MIALLTIGLPARQAPSNAEREAFSDPLRRRNTVRNRGALVARSHHLVNHDARRSSRIPLARSERF